jgi:hypothetical protein
MGTALSVQDKNPSWEKALQLSISQAQGTLHAPVVRWVS